VPPSDASSKKLLLHSHIFSLEEGISLARALTFAQKGDEGTLGKSRAFSLPASEREPLVAVSNEGGVNCDLLTLCVHGAGTHTESPRHVYGEGLPAYRAAPDDFILAQVFDCKRVPKSEAKDAYAGQSSDEDFMVERASFEELHAGVVAVIARVYDVLVDDFSQSNPAYFSDEAMRHLRAQGVRHFLTDLPSVDRENDGGKVSAHKSFFGSADAERTITELCDLRALSPGLYALSLQVPAFESDAAPSRPIVFRALDAASAQGEKDV